MSSITNINNNSSVVNVGRTTPITPGAKTASESIPVVVATDQTPIPVEEQNAIKSEVSLSLLGIPRAEVALGIFADVNTYDVTPSEWSSLPVNYVSGYGIKHLPEEAGALVESRRNDYAVLTSKRFFRYQPGRVSSATFGVKTTVSQNSFYQNPVIRKFGIFDNFDGYYWETRENGEDDNFAVVRRTQSLFKTPATPFGIKDEFTRPTANSSTTVPVTQTSDYRFVGNPSSEDAIELQFVKDRQIITENKFIVIDAALQDANLDYVEMATQISGETADSIEEKCKRDLEYWIDFFIEDLAWGGDAHTSWNTYNYDTAVLANTANEVAVHQALQTQLTSLNLSVDANNKIEELANVAITFFQTEQNPSGLDFGNKSKLETGFDVRKNYWSYIVSDQDANGNPITYDEYTSGGRTFTAEEVKYKCQRDVQYVIEGYRDDLLGGGNAATKYNASMYYKGTGRSVGSQSPGEDPPTAEIERHTYLKQLVLTDLNNSVFNSETEIINKFNELSDLIISNFSDEDISTVEYGTRAVRGNLVVLRDGLVHVHAAVYDPSLLKERKKIRAQANSAENTFKLTENTVTFGQYVTYFDPNDNGISELQDGKTYKVKSVNGPKGNEFTLIDPVTDGDITFSSSSDDAYFQIVHPFVFPKDYQSPNSTFPNGMMFPYKYVENGYFTEYEGNDLSNAGNLNTRGDINTVYNSNAPQTIAIEIDSVNFVPEHINWIKNNVKPEYYGVYEYRVPRSRFSNDHLNGKNNNQFIYSDETTGPSGKVSPGEAVEGVKGNSVYNFDFTKVTMLKIEFSWYGAVGALFLAYVPVSNDEARWVRVHHLRASNQLKVASLGNATLPITYNVWGGGTADTLGEDPVSNFEYGSNSHHIVKYGASYYIDGGDRGTVRLYSHTNDTPVSAYGRNYEIGSVTFESNNAIDGLEDYYYFDRTPAGGEPANEFFMNSIVKTGDIADQNLSVIWVTDDKIFISAKNEPSGNDVTLISDRANLIYGLETKNEIISTRDKNKVRNRIQVYPTKLSTANLGSNPVKMKMKKSPIFQTNVQPTGSFQLDDVYTITADSNPLPTSDSNYLEENEEIYGWFRVEVGSEKYTALGKLYKEASNYYFDLITPFNGIVNILPGIDFLADLRFNAQGGTSVSKTTYEKENLSSILISEQLQVPIPNTGTNIATIFLDSGTEQLDLASYYDYNKEYLSFPLTNIPDTLYFAADMTANNDIESEVSIGVTWEEQ